MKKIALITSSILFALPIVASAHAHASYLIGGTQYDIVIGSLNEPIVVDDKTGLDLRVTSGGRMQVAEDGDMEPVGGTPAIGLEQTLQVEMISGDTKKTMDISPVFNTPGSYKTAFYPTSNAQFSYRLFGEINGVDVDLSFTCLPQGGTAPEHEEEKEISADVQQLMRGGSFGCALAKELLGFPEDTRSLSSLGGGSHSLSIAALALAALALAFSFRRRS
jgi:MYXO-CTERM domain-containing protein